MRQQLKTVLEGLKIDFEKSSEWNAQLRAVQKIYQLVLVDNQFNSPQLNLLMSDELQQFLQSPETAKIIQSMRSTLSREAMIVLEFVIQRYGSACQQFALLLVDVLFGLLQKKGVYFECQSVSLLKAIIVHTGASKVIFTKIVANLKSCRVPSAKCYLFDLALTALAVMRLTSQYDTAIAATIQDACC